MRKILWIIVILLCSLLAIHYAVDYFNTKKTTQYIKSFSYNTTTLEFPQAESKIYPGQHKPFKKAVLLLHGYSASPQEFTSLLEALKKADIPYYSPRMLGFGLGNLNLLRNIKYQDFLRDALNAYDLLAALSEKIDIVGHSNGGTLALLISQLRPVNKIVLSSPYLTVSHEYQRYKEGLEHPIVGPIMCFLLPIFSKPVKLGAQATGRDTLNQNAAIKMFHYPALPLQSLLAIWQLQDQLNVKNSSAKAIYLLYGAHDSTFPINSILNLLKSGKFTLKISIFSNSAHNLFEDYDSKEVIKQVIKFLNDESRPA